MATRRKRGVMKKKGFLKEENEKKYILKSDPINREEWYGRWIGDVYLNRFVRVRIESSTKTLVSRYYLTIKIGEGEKRYEFERRIPKWLYYFLAQDKNILWKRRISLSRGVTIDYIESKLYLSDMERELIVLEIENGNKYDQKILEDILKRHLAYDVTKEKKYRGYNLYKLLT